MTPETEAVETQHSPIAKAINRLMALEGGQLLRRRMIEGHAQWWVVRHDGASVAAHNLTDLARFLGVNIPKQENPNMETTDNYVNIHKAVKISGYSSWRIRNAAHAGEIKTMKVSPRGTVFHETTLLAWAEKNKALGGSHLPRGRSRRLKVNSDIKRGNRRPPGNRLDRYLETLEGTPLAMSRDEFVERVIDQALDKLNAQ